MAALQDKAARAPASFVPLKSEPALPAAKMTWAVASSPGAGGKERRSFTPTTPIRPERRTYTPTTPMTRMPGHGPSKPTTPMMRARRTSPTAGMRAVAEARAPADESPAPAQVKTDVSRRALAREAALGTGATIERPPQSLRRDLAGTSREISRDSPRSSGPVAKGLTPPPRIRILDADDERRKLDPYELIGEIASGGMATVVLGRLAGAGGFSRFVAIKQLHPHLAREEQFVQMFLDEARLAAGIHNPHVVPILEVGMSRGGYFLVMEFIEGDTLAGLTVRLQKDGGTLPAPIALRIMVDALAGLHAAHQLTDADGVHLGLIHRDCTPQNILIGVDGSARLTDFGVARAASRLAITRPQQVKGKVAYLSPEQAHAMDLDRRSDLFTMGIVLWEALAGRPLFQAENEATTLSRVVSGPIPSVRSYVPDMPAALDEVCRRALHRDRNRRFRTAAEMAEALERAADAEGFAGVASPRELGKFVETSMGAELLAQRDAVRADLAPKSAAPPSSSASRSARPPLSVRGTASAVSLRGEPASEARGRAQAAAAARPVSSASSAPASSAPASLAPASSTPASSAPASSAPAASTPAPTADGAQPSTSAAAPSEASAPTPSPPPTGAAAPTAPAADSVEKTLPAAAAPELTAAASPGSSTGKRGPGSAEATQGPGLVATARVLLARAASVKMSTGRGIALAALLVIIATSPIWIKATNRLLHPPDPAATHEGERAPRSPRHPGKALPASPDVPPPNADPAPAPAPTEPAKGWDEGDWVLPGAATAVADAGAAP